MSSVLRYPEPHLPTYLRAGRTTAAWIRDWQRWDAWQGRRLNVREAAVALYWRLNPQPHRRTA